MKQLIFAGLILLTAGCGDDSGMDAATDTLPDADGNLVRLMCPLATPPTQRTCEPAASDFLSEAEDTWDACIADSGSYSLIDTTPSSIARVEAFERIGALLFDPNTEPSAQDYIDARFIYQENEGLDSRVVRRYDPHVDSTIDCTNPDVAPTNPEYCVGPTVLQPMILDAFTAGAAEGGRSHAGTIYGALLRFLYVSTFKEATTCATAAKDCDSTYAYYTGGEDRDGGIGLAAQIRAIAPDSHDRIWDGLLALRCWRDLDNAPVAEDTTLHLRARTQLDTALSHGLAQLIRAQLSAACESTSEGARDFFTASVRALGPALIPVLKQQDAAAAARYQAAWSAMDADPISQEIDTSFMCP